MNKEITGGLFGKAVPIREESIAEYLGPQASFNRFISHLGIEPISKVVERLQSPKGILNDELRKYWGKEDHRDTRSKSQKEKDVIRIQCQLPRAQGPWLVNELGPSPGL